MDFTGKPVWANPLAVLETSGERCDVVEGFVPMRGITWMYGPSMSFKTFIAMGMAAAVSTGRDWMGLATEPSVVLYLGAEGGDALHLRRAALETDAGDRGLLFVVQERPALDTDEGAAELRNILMALTRYEHDGATASDKYWDVGVFDAMIDSDCSYRVLCVIDTYSQTSAGDEKANVSAFIKNLRNIIEEGATGCETELDISFLVLDHATKGGGSYLGSVAKLNDVDSQLEVIRASDKQLVRVHQRKRKDGEGRATVDIELVPFVFEGYTDAYGKNLQTLVAKDGSKTKALVDISSSKAGLLLDLLEDSGDSLPEDVARARFLAHPSHGDGNKPDTVGKAYRRAKERLLLDGLIELDGGVMTRK
ncbi:MAG: hypothetical protein RI988_2035 [Pseudomonadota bacterium]|jgi:hypothetical protein